MSSLYVIIDPEHCASRDPVWVAERSLAGGCAALQLRSKSQPDSERLPLARALRELARQYNVPFWINDRADLAMLSQADGLHLGQTDLPPAEARRLVGTTMQLGLSTHSLAQAQAAESLGVELLGFGPLFTTRSKANPDPEVGTLGLAEVLRAVALPVVAIGGVNLDNVTQVALLRPAYVAVISAVCGAADPESATRELVRALSSPGSRST